MSFTFCTSSAIIVKAGANASSTAIASAAILETFSDSAESTINVATRKNWNTAFATLDVDVKSILEETAASLAGSNIITYDMSGYTSRGEAESMITVLRDNYMRNIQLLKEIKRQTFMENA